MLTECPTPAMLAEWKQLFAAHRKELTANRRSGAEVDAYFRAQYPHTVLDDAAFASGIAECVLANAHSREKLPEGAEPDIRCYRTGEVLVSIDLVTGEFFTECEDIAQAAAIHDDLFVYRGLDEQDLDNYYLVAAYIQLTRKT